MTFDFTLGATAVPGPGPGEGFAGAPDAGFAGTPGEGFVPGSVLITGGAGFIGSHVVRAVRAAFPHAAIVVLDLLDACASLGNLDFAQIDRFVQGDVRDCDTVLGLLRHHAVDAVLHFAAQTHVDNSFGNSIAFTLHNTHGTHALLEACRVYGGIRRFVNVSTDEVYGETNDDKAREDTAVLEPTNPYAAAKAGAELMGRAYHASFGLPVITTRGNNVYGPNQYPEKVVPKFIMRRLRGLPPEIHGDGSAVRSFVYVDDAAEAYVLILSKGRVGGVYNIGSPDERSVSEIAACVFPGVRPRYVRDRAFNDRRYFVCDRKLAALGWTPTTSWDEGFARTMAWYKEHGETHWGDCTAALAAHPSGRLL